MVKSGPFIAAVLWCAISAAGPGFASSSADAHTASDGIHEVQAGENLFRIALNHGFSTEELASANGIAAPYTIHPGQRLVIPQRQDEVARLLSAPSQPDLVEIRYSEPRPSIDRNASSMVDGLVPNFLWPVEGRVVSHEHQNRDGSVRPGWTIEVVEGAPIKAAAGGEVIYAGSGVPGFENLILVRHNSDWVTAYANNQSVHVSQGAQVEAGQTIATAPRSRFRRNSQVYFEIRDGINSVDPSRFLSNGLNLASSGTQ